MSKEGVRIPGKVIAVAGDMVMGVVYALQDAVWVVEDISRSLHASRQNLRSKSQIFESSRKNH